MIELFKGVEALKQEALLIADKLGNPDVLANESLYQQTLTRYDDVQEQLNKMNAYGYEGEIRSVLHGFQFYPEDYDKPIQQLSGGQRTRLALAKILLEKHDVLILDEPTNHLDIKYQLELMTIVKRLDATVVSAIHDLNLAAIYCDRIIALKDGYIVCSGTPQEVLTTEIIRHIYGVSAMVQTLPDGRLNIIYNME